MIFTDENLLYKVAVVVGQLYLRTAYREPKNKLCALAKSNGPPIAIVSPTRLDLGPCIFSSSGAASSAVKPDAR